jgi:hypothetical protein
MLSGGGDAHEVMKPGAKVQTGETRKLDLTAVLTGRDF